MSRPTVAGYYIIDWKLGGRGQALEAGQSVTIGYYDGTPPGDKEGLYQYSVQVVGDDGIFSPDEFHSFDGPIRNKDGEVVPPPPSLDID